MKYCAVPTCGNSSYINYRGKASRCRVHGCKYGTDTCKCEPPLQFFPFPTKKDLEGREQWAKLINRKYPNGESWQPDPAGRSTVCSAHFPDGHPTKRNPDPILKLGYEPPAELIRRPQPTQPRKKKKTGSKSKPEDVWPVPLPTVQPRVLLACPHSSVRHQPVTNISSTMTAIIPQTKRKPRPPKRLCIACQNISEHGQRISSNRGRLDLQKCLKQYLNLEVEQGWMCINCVRQVKTIVKKVNMFRKSVLGGQCNRVYDISQVHVGEENGSVITEMQSDLSIKPTESVCQCSRLLMSMLSKQNISEPMEKTKIKVIFPKPTEATATDPGSESSEDLRDSSSPEEEDGFEQRKKQKRRTRSNKGKKIAWPRTTSVSVSRGSQHENEQLTIANQTETGWEVPTTSSDSVRPVDAQVRVIFPGQCSSASYSSPVVVSSPGCIQAAPIILITQPTASDSSTPISIPGLPAATPAPDGQTDFVYTKTLNELAKYIARKPVQEHDYTH